MKEIEKSGKTVDEAIDAALKELNLSLANAQIEVLDTPEKGFLGLFAHPARVRVKEREDFDSVDFPSLRSEPAEKAPAKPAKKAAPAPAAVPAPDPADIITDYTPAQQKTVDFLRELSALLGAPAEVVLLKTENGLMAQLSGERMGHLIGYRGETLDALQYLASQVLNRDEEDYCRLTLDTENYRQKREQALIALARRTADRAIRTGRRVSLEPMNPYERRIIHAALQDYPGVTTHSEGTDPHRHLVVTPE